MLDNKPFVTKQYVLPECMICGKPTHKIHYYEDRKSLRGVRKELVSKIPVPAHNSCWLPRNLALFLFFPAFLLLFTGVILIFSGEKFLDILSACLPGMAFAYVFVRVGISLNKAKDKSKMIGELLEYLITLKDEPGSVSSWANPAQRDLFYRQEITKLRDQIMQKQGEGGGKLIDRIANYAVEVGCSRKSIDFLYAGLARPEISAAE